MSRNGGEVLTGCGCWIIFAIVNLTLGALCFDYSLSYIFAKDVPWYADMVCGLFLGEFTIPAAIICWILNMCGIPAPLVG